MRNCVCLFVLLFSVTLAGQQQAPPKAPQPPAAPQAPAAPAPPPVNIEEGGQPINIRLDVSIIDQTGQGPAVPKSLMVMLVDRAAGRTRAAFQDRSINVDARPVISDGRIRVNLTIVSELARSFAPPPEQDQTLNWRNGFSLLLENGKPMVALETMDAATKRKMSIEVKATIQK